MGKPCLVCRRIFTEPAPWCSVCRVDCLARLQRLASNLAVAAGLCAAYDCGWGVGYDDAAEEDYHDRIREHWQPGCGRVGTVTRGALPKQGAADE